MIILLLLYFGSLTVILSFFKFINSRPSKSIKMFDESIGQDDMPVLIAMSLVPIFNSLLLLVFIIGFIVDGAFKLGEYITKNL